MKINDRPASRRNRTLLSRVLACALLVGIVYAATFGSAHSHLDASSKLGITGVASVAGHADFAFTTPVNSNSHKYECLVCLFHQQLSNSTVAKPLFIAKPSVKADLVPEPTIFSYSDPITSTPIARLSGRAPPVA